MKNSQYNQFAFFYDRLTADVNYKERAAYFKKIMSGHGIDSGILLDLACGTGSLSMEMERLGFDVIATDASEQMLSVAMNKKYRHGLKTEFLCQKMQKLDLYGTVDAVICALDSINHLTKEKEVRETFERVSLFLNPGGLFIFDVNSLYKHREILGDNCFVYDYDGVYCVWQNEARPGNVTKISLDIFEKRGDCYIRHREEFMERAYTHEEILSFLEQAGLKLTRVYGGDSFDPPAQDTQRLVYVAGKAVH